MANPTLLTSPIAENGEKNVIPASTGATTGLLDQEHGFQQINELPLQAGGLPPQRKDFNGVFNLLSGILYMVQRGYTFEYDNTLPYVVGCIVIDPLDGKTYRCVNDVPVGSPNPSTDTTNWAKYDLLDGLKYRMGLHGYICLGSLFGNLILQWGQNNIFQNETTINLPISFTNVGYKILLQGIDNSYTYYNQIPLIGSRTATSFKAKVPSYGVSFLWFAIGY